MEKGGYREADIRVARAAEQRLGFTVSAWQRGRPRFVIKRRLSGFAGPDSRQTGFTIVEVLIVLAVTGVMFISAAAFINGRQNRTQFTTAINSLQQQIQQIINETENGFYPNSGTFTCVPNATGPVTFNSTSSKQGTNGGCIFLGKALQFGISSSGSGASTLDVLPLVGNQYQSGIPILTVAQSKPRAVYPGTGSAEATVPDASSTSLMEDGLTIAASNSACGVGMGGMCYVDNVTSTKTATGVVAFVAGDSAGNITSLDSGGNLEAGSEQLSLYGVVTSVPNETPTQASIAIGGPTSPYVSNLKPASSASICVANPSTNQSGLFTIDSGLHVSLAIKAGLTC